MSLGASPPEQVLTGNFQYFGYGPHWFVTDTDHPITEGYRMGQAVQYGDPLFLIKADGE